MKRLFTVMLFILTATSGAMAVESPHVDPLGCYDCHTLVTTPGGGFTLDMAETVGANNLCLKCHNPGLLEKSFRPGDIANPFGSTTLQNYTAVRKQTSHNWAAPVVAPKAGAAIPLNVDMASLTATKQGVISCASCHNQHAFQGGKLLRFDNTSDQLCFDCHRSRNTTDVAKGTHPVTVDYAAIAAARPADFLATPQNANPANPTSAMRLANGQVVCTTCHGVHSTDSNARTVDGFSTPFENLSTSQGYLLRTDLRGGTATDVNICTNCHAGKLAHNRKGQNIQCADCHGGHVDPGDGTRPNVWLIRRYMNYSGGIKLDSYRRKVLNQDVGDQSNFAGPFGVCQACHPVPPPGGSYPAEHASTDPNVCRSCHLHNSKDGSFSASCTSCHGFPPQANTPGGPEGYAAGYATSGVFKDESMTGHMAHAGKAPYSFSCFECHGGNKHAAGNYQQVFLSTAGNLAATGGASPLYNGNGTCSSVYCHSNGAPAGGGTVYRTPAWANAKGSIVGTAGECSACHDASPATNAHSGHLNATYGFKCSFCHAATVNDAKVIINIDKHVNGSKDVMFSGTATIGGTGSYDSTAYTCSNLYCHSNGNPNNLVYVTPAAWTSGANYGCNGCHGTSSPVGAPDYANGGAGLSTANSHAAHTRGATDTIVCSNCHFATASATAGGTLVASSKHLSGAVDVVFNPAVAGANAKWNAATGTCENVACHGGAPAQWGSKAGCLTCHSVSVNGRAAIGSQFGANSHHVQAGSLDGTHCYQCHWEANSDGTINSSYHHSNMQGGPIELVVYGAGARPAQYVAGSTAIQYTANGTRTEIAKINSHCLGCHSDQNNTTQPFGDGKTPNTYAWDSQSIATKYGDTATTPWGKYSGTNITPKNTVTKAFSAHGNAVNNKGGWDTSETWKDRGATTNVFCFDCHNSHGSTVEGTTTSYASATTNGGILKATVAGKGGYFVTYQPAAGGSPAEHNQYNAGAGLCFDCHMNGTAGATPWGYTSTYGSTQQIMGYMDSAFFGNSVFGNQLRYPYKGAVPNMGGHFGASSALSSTPAHQIGGLCTPCHDPHGVSPTFSANKIYAVPLLKGTWVTSPYMEDVATADNQTYMGLGGSGEESPRFSSSAKAAYQAAIATSYHIDQNTFATASASAMNAKVTGVTQADVQFAGLCLNCHAKQNLTNGTTHTWKTKDRIHESVKGWKTANTTVQHNYTCSKCHAPHNADLPRLMVTNCLDSNHRGRTVFTSNPQTSASKRGDERSGSGHMPGSYSGSSRSSTNFTCHENNDSTQAWNMKTPWGSSTTSTAPSVPVLVTEPDATCSGSCPTNLQWGASANPAGTAVQYSVQVSSNATFSSVNYSSGWISGTSWSVTLSQGTWYWRVQARDASSISKVSAWSPVGSFTLSGNTSTPTAPSIPVLLAEPDGICSGSCGIQLQWAASSTTTGNAVQYSVDVSSSSSFSTFTTSGWITGTTWTPTLNAGTWYWRVQARDAVSTSLVSGYSMVNSFTLSAPQISTPPTAPVLVNEGNSTCSSYSGCSTTLQWNASTMAGGGSIEYLVQVSSSSSFSSWSTSSSGWVSGTSWAPTLKTGTWYWRVQARSAADTTLVSPWSSVDSFSVSSSYRR